MNSKSDLIFDMTSKEKYIVETTKETGEFGAVINTIVSIDKFPRYTYGLLKSKPNLKYASLALPYHLAKEDFESVFKAKEVSISNLNGIIKRENDYLDSLRQETGYWKTAEPPLARLLSVPAINYMKMVLDSDRVYSSLDSAISSPMP